MWIFLDESGDLGFDLSKKGTSPYFVITILVCDHKQAYDKIKTAVRRTLKNKLNNRKNNKRVIQELKGEATAPGIKEYFLRNFPDEGWRLYSVTLNKRRTEEHLQTKAGKKKLYNFLARFLLEKVDFPEDLSVVNLAVDRCKNSEEIRDFNQYVQNQLEALLPLNTRLYITHETSHDNPGLQAVDMFCWGFARLGHGDDGWYKLFRPWVKFQTIYLPDK